ncbi:MAG: hypothetical protein FD153_1497, partial [Rhodospirillaceae bacterium]
MTAIPGDAAVQAVVADWRCWLANERRASPHTVDGYGHDLSAFLTFLAGYQGA